MKLIQFFRHFFGSSVQNRRQVGVICLVAVVVIFLPKEFGVDWELNTRGFWSNFPNTYNHNPDFVYPPWGLILMLPYWLMCAEGARFFSVLVVGWLVIEQKWSLSVFLSIILSPYFIFSMLFSNMDILVTIFPLLLWKKVDGTCWQNVGWGFAMSILLLKPQAAFLILLYLLWTNRKRYKEIFVSGMIMVLLVAPVSLFGTPPLIVQWLNNILHPSVQNEVRWSMNNVSLMSDFNFAISILILGIITGLLILLRKKKQVEWTDNHTIAGLLLGSMLISPYASQQGVSSALAFIPSWGLTAVQYAGYIFALVEWPLKMPSSVRVLLIGFMGLLIFRKGNGQDVFMAGEDIHRG